MRNIYPDCRVIERAVFLGESTKDELRQALQDNSIQLNEYAERLFGDVGFVVSASPNKINTVELTVSDLGFADRATTSQVFEKARELGLELCSLEVGPCLRLQYLDQPVGYWIIVASAKLSDDSDIPNGFYLRRLDDGLWLRGYHAEPQYKWSSDDHFVFCSKN